MIQSNLTKHHKPEKLLCVTAAEVPPPHRLFQILGFLEPNFD